MLILTPALVLSAFSIFIWCRRLLLEDKTLLNPAVRAEEQNRIISKLEVFQKGDWEVVKEYFPELWMMGKKANSVAALLDLTAIEKRSVRFGITRDDVYFFAATMSEIVVEESWYDSEFEGFKSAVRSRGTTKRLEALLKAVCAEEPEMTLAVRKLKSEGFKIKEEKLVNALRVIESLYGSLVNEGRREAEWKVERELETLDDMAHDLKMMKKYDNWRFYIKSSKTLKKLKKIFLYLRSLVLRKKPKEKLRGVPLPKSDSDF